MQRITKLFHIVLLSKRQPIQTIPLGTSPDNVFEDHVGDLWTGSHAVGIKTVEHLNDVNKIAPSQVTRDQQYHAQLPPTPPPHTHTNTLH